MVKQPLCWYLYYSSVMLCLCVGRMVCISLFKLLWTGSRRLLGFLWKRNTTVSCLEVYWINFKHQIYSTLRSTFSVLQAHWFNNAPSPPPTGLIGSLFSLLQFLASPVTGALSDSYGRRPLLMLTTVRKTSLFKDFLKFCLSLFVL